MSVPVPPQSQTQRSKDHGKKNKERKESSSTPSKSIQKRATQSSGTKLPLRKAMILLYPSISPPKASLLRLTGAGVNRTGHFSFYREEKKKREKRGEVGKFGI
jgi:hypothetical protein